MSGRRFSGRRRTSRQLAGLFVALLVVGSATLFAVQPAAAASYPDAEQACAETGDGQQLIGVLPGSSTATDAQVLTGSEDNASLYPGTTLRLALCKDSGLAPTRGSEWTLGSSSGLEVLDATDTHVTVRVTDESEHVDVLGLVDEKEGIPAVSIDVPRPSTVDSELANGTITFENESAAQQYEDGESAYLAAVSNLTETTEALNESAAAVESGDAKPENVTGESLTAIDDSTESVTEARRELERQLYGTAWRAQGGSNALAALDAAREREQSAQASADGAMRNYLGTLETAESDARSTALLNLVGALLVGLVVGAVPGWKLTASKLEDIRRDREVNSRVSYSPRVLAWAAGLATLALVLTLAALFALNGFDALGGLL